MSPRKRRNLLVAGLLAVPLTAALISHLHCNGNRPNELHGTALEGHQFPVQALAFGSDGATLTTVACSLLSPSGQGEVIIWDTGTGLRLATRTVPLGELLTLTFAPGARTLATSGRDGTLGLWDTATWHEQQRLNQDRFLVSALAFSADGRQLAAADHLHVTLWDLASGQKTCCQGHHQRSCALAFAPDARTLASGNEDVTIRLWDTATGEGRGILQGHDRAVLTLAYSPDGRLLASGDFGGTVKLWDVDAEKERATLTTSGNEVAALAFSPDSGTLAVAVGSAVQLWEVGTGRLVACLEGHDGQVKCLAFSPDGTRLASGSYDRTVRLWNVARYRPLEP
jgi:WD40 repeat protein